MPSGTYFLLLVQKKVGKEKGTPLTHPPAAGPLNKGKKTRKNNFQLAFQFNRTGGNLIIWHASTTAT